MYFFGSTAVMQPLRAAYGMHNRGEAIRVARVVVVDIAARVDIPRIVRIAAVRRAQTNVLRFNLHPILSRIGFVPPREQPPCVDSHLRPIPYLFALQMK